MCSGTLTRDDEVECGGRSHSIRDPEDLFVVANCRVSVPGSGAQCYAGRKRTYWHHALTGSVPFSTTRANVMLVLAFNAAIIT